MLGGVDHLAARTPAAPAAEAVVVTWDSPATRKAAVALAATLALPFREPGCRDAALVLVQTADGLELHDAASSARLRVDYTAAELRRFRAGTGRDPFRRALGPGERRVIDATAGLGRDAVHAVMLGHEVVAIERNPIVSALAHDGLVRARAAGRLPPGNPEWHTGDARELIPALAAADTIYLDPLFPPKRKKSAATRKEMRLLRLLAGPGGNDIELLEVARACARERVVVKRPLDAPPLAPGRIAAYPGKLVRYDLYRAGG
ncbi:MAG TPA: class I SAM-dependent methyltransferase [Burkholderiales bacterium]